jgi:hypothetical protein
MPGTEEIAGSDIDCLSASGGDRLVFCLLALEMPAGMSAAGTHRSGGAVFRPTRAGEGFRKPCEPCARSEPQAVALRAVVRRP